MYFLSISLEKLIVIYRSQKFVSLSQRLAAIGGIAFESCSTKALPLTADGFFHHLCSQWI